jgi:hypothetical protein
VSLAVAPAVRAGLSYASGPGRWVLLVTVLGSAMASIDATVVGLARPAIGRDFGASLTTPADYHAVAPGVLLRPPAGAVGLTAGSGTPFPASPPSAKSGSACSRPTAAYSQDRLRRQ